MVTIELDGVPALLLLRALEQMVQQADLVLTQALAAEAERILEASLPLVPVDTGLFLSTGMVERDAHGATIRYGGHGLAPYAVVVHEDVTMQHPRGGQAKFLQAPVFAALDGMPARVGAHVQDGLRRA